MDPVTLRTAHRGPDGEPSKHPDDGVAVKNTSGIARHNTILTTVAACVVPILYLFYINHYAVSALFGDEWNVIPIIHGSLHGHLSLSEIWSQYNETRVPLVRIILVAFAHLDRLDTRAVIFLNAAIFIVSYALLLGLFRRYVNRPLTPIPVVIIGLVWFSLANVQTSLWAFQVGWYLVVLSFVVMLLALFAPKGRRTLWLVVAVFVAVIASMSFLQGFILWPLGAICILWRQSWSRRVSIEIASWIGATIVTATLYFATFNFSLTGCVPELGCTPRAAYSHPLTAFHFLLILIGNVIPGGYFGSSVKSLARFEWLGASLLVSALFIAVQSWRHRISTEHVPLPLMLISFGLLFDVIIALGRTGEKLTVATYHNLFVIRTGVGLTGAINNNRYVLPNLILLTGIMMYAMRHLPRLCFPKAGDVSKNYITWVIIFGLAIFVVVQVRVAIGFGLQNARLDHTYITDGARLAVNLDRLPIAQQTCELVSFFIPPSDIRDASEDQLGEFRPNTYRYYRKLGLPPLSPSCSKAASNSKAAA